MHARKNSIRRVLIPDGIPERVAKEYRIRTGAETIKKVRKILSRYEYIQNANVCQFIEDQKRILDQGKVPPIVKNKNVSFLDGVFMGIEALLGQVYDISVREFSIRVYNDSKLFMTLFPVIKKIMDPEDNLDSVEFLSMYHVCRNSIYALMKGNFLIRFKNGEELRMDAERGSIQVDSTFVRNIESIDAKLCESIENLESFDKHTVTDADGLIVYLGGFSTNVNVELIRKTSCPIIHFGDIDANGFKILHDLQKRVGKDVEMYLMDNSIVEKYREYGKPITEYNRKMFIEMLEASEYSEKEKESFRKSLEYGVTIEQEIVHERDD